MRPEPQPSESELQPQTTPEEKKEAGLKEVTVPRESITERQLSEVREGEGSLDGKEIPSQIKDIYFDFDSYAVREDGKPSLKELAAVLSQNKRLKVIIEGHCDDRGTTEYNLGLGDRRAQSVKTYMGSMGIPSAKVETISYGEEKPLCTEQSETCWSKNRRAHFVLIEGGK
ncbi:MAG: peptidoglycan-associated lipoprotein Pal [Nitrospirales bacterium]|nr:peptidoglycan-associated lipoprotein Pal [Nitrospirales bacterium]